MQAETKKNIAPAFFISLTIHTLLAVAIFLSVDSARVDSPLGVSRKGNPAVIEVSLESGTTVIPLAIQLRTPKGSKPLSLGSEVDIPSGQAIEKVGFKTAISKSSTLNALSDRTAAKGKDAESDQNNLGAANGAATSGPLGHQDGVSTSERDRYINELRLLIASRKTYPISSRRLGETGLVIVKFEIHRSGRIDQLAVKDPSSHQKLNEAALELVGGIRQFKPFPPGETSESLSVEVPIEYKLR